MQETVSRRSRPLGVTIISVVLAIQGIFELIVGILLIVAFFALGHTVATHGHTTVRAIIDTFGGVLGGISIIVGLLTLLFAWGLWTLKRWAFWLTVVLEVIILIRHLLEFAHSNNSTGIVGLVIGIALPVIILLYFLVDPYVRRAFRV